MINDEEKFYSYLKGKMNKDDKKNFETELSNSIDLNNKFIEYKNLNNILDKVKEVRLNSDYTESIITNFRKNIESKKTKRNYIIARYAFFPLIAAVGMYFLIISFDNDSLTDVPTLVSDYSDAELDSFSNQYHFSSRTEDFVNEYDANTLDSIYNSNLSGGLIESISENKIDDILNINNVSDANEYLTENDVDEIYDQLINKEIL
jgi:hypothetical protein